MPLDKSALVDELARLTADLQPFPGTGPEGLEEARAVIAQAVASGQSESPGRAAAAPPPPPAAAAAPARVRLEAAAEAALSQPAEEPQFLVARRDVPLAATSLANVTPEWAVGRAAERTLGPFRDALGRPVWIDIFPIVRFFHLVRSPGAAPFLALPLRGLIPSGHQFNLPAGSVWIASPLLAAGAPAGSYTGLKIRGGTLTFSQNLTASGNEFVVPLTVTCTLSLDLDPGTAPSGSGPGEDARLAAVDLPKKATFIFSSTGARIQSADKGHLRVYGSDADIEPTNNPPTYQASVARIFVPAKTGAPNFSAADVRSDQFQPSGQAGIAAAAWALPVAVVSPDSLGNASGSGGLALSLKDGLALTWEGSSTPAPAGPVVLVVDPGLITLVALTARNLGGREIIPLWSKQPGGPPSSQIELSWPAQFPLHYFSSSAGTELLFLAGAVKGNFDRPVTVAGHRVFVQSKAALIVFVESAVFRGVLVEGALEPPPPPTNAYAFALENAVLRTTPAASLLLVAAYDGTPSKQGGVAIGFGLQYLLPTLPDPYAANVDVPYQRLRDTGIIGTLTSIVTWSPGNPPLLTYTLPPNAAALTHPLAPSTGSALVEQRAAAIAAAASRGGGALVLLDLSTNVDQFGVAWTSGRDLAPGAAFAVESLYLASPSDSVYVLTVPAVQWEPVFTEPAPDPAFPAGFPSPMTFADSGGPTAITVQSVQLVRVAPAPALDNLVANFAGDNPPPAQAWLTLPFGIQAFSVWYKPGRDRPRGASVDYNRPKFSAEAVEGGYQISVRAIDPASPDSPSLQGFTTQLRNGLYAGVPANKSILDDQVDTIFNGYLGPSGLRPQVPVTRFDLSGYGESLFSHWLNNTDDPVAVSQARFDVLIGRTSYEVIQVRSILYPYGVRVVRTITIDRKNSAVVVRHDSGWQAVSDGEYLFPGVGLTVHPGVVQRISGVTNIRDTGQFLDVGGGAQVAGVWFDGNLAIDGVVKGASPAGVPARDQVGYVQLTPASSGCLTPAQYQQLINTAGPLGGNIDCVLSVGGGSLKKKLGRVGIGVTQGMGGPEFVMTAWGSPQFPQGGQWSFLKQTGAGTAPEVLASDLGVPLIRAGAAPNPPPLNSPYRFADPADLATPDTPASDYGIVHATGTQRTFFPRPKVEAGAPTAITSTVAPVLADPYSLATAVGYFPRTDSAIPFPDANYSLVISGGAYKLQMPSSTFPVTVGQRTIAEAAGVHSYADYTGSTVELAIDTSAPVPWSFNLKQVASAMSSGSMGEVMRVTGDMAADANTPANMGNSQVVFGGALGVVQQVMNFLQALGMPTPMTVSQTQAQVKVALKIPMDDELNKLMPPCGPHFEDTDVTVGVEIDFPVSKAEFEASGTLFLPTTFTTCAGVPPELSGLQAVGLFGFDAKLSTDFGTAITLTVGAGVGVSFKLTDDFKVTAYYVETEFLIFGDVLGLGVGALLKGSIDLEVISIDVSIEAKMAILEVQPSSLCSDLTVWAAAQVTFALEITIAWVIDIDIEVQSEWSQNMNGGPCALPDVL